MNKLYIVCVPIGMDDYPQKIFDSINATGAKLTASDLIRNFILMPIRSDLQDMYYENYWKRLEQLIDNDSKKLEAFFRFILSEMPAPLLMELYAIHKSADDRGGTRIAAKQLAEIITILNSYLMRRSLCVMDFAPILCRNCPDVLEEVVQCSTPLHDR